MSRKSSRPRIASAMACLSQVLLLLLFSASIPGAGVLEANEYGEIEEKAARSEPAAPEEAFGLAGEGAQEAATWGPAEVGDLSVSSGAEGGFGEDATAEMERPEANETEAADSAGSDEVEEVTETAEPTMAEAVVYVFNNDDDALSISLFIDSELKETEDVSKEKEKKFGSYQLEAGSHSFKIAWWDDDTKKGHQEELIATVEGATAITLYSTRNKEPEEFEVNVMLRNENREDLEAYLYIDGEYEKQKTAKKESTTDFGKFDLEEGTHDLAVRWQDPETNIEYEKRKTLRVDGKDAVTFYAPQGMTFESDEKAASTATEPKRTTSTRTAPSTTREDGGEEEPSSTGDGGPREVPSEADEVEAAAGKGETAKEEDAMSASGREPPSDGWDGDAAPDLAGRTLYVSAIGAILALYIIFFRR
ncbi:hypothetical protein [Methanocrinis sp.]|uniref:hypothetical protein n=1 Tax=Methanocrinis sp. TaxID=3101522 RepID=UPI003D133F1F